MVTQANRDIVHALCIFPCKATKKTGTNIFFSIIFYYCHDSSDSRIEKSILIDYQVDQPLKCKSFSVWRGLLSFNISQGKKTVAMRVHLVAADTLNRKGIVEVLLKLTRWSKALSLWRGYWLFCFVVWEALLHHDIKNSNLCRKCFLPPSVLKSMMFLLLDYFMLYPFPTIESAGQPNLQQQDLEDTVNLAGLKSGCQPHVWRHFLSEPQHMTVYQYNNLL